MKALVEHDYSAAVGSARETLESFIKHLLNLDKNVKKGFNELAEDFIKNLHNILIFQL